MKGGRQAGVGRREWNPPLQFSPSLPFELWSHTDCVLEENKKLNPLILKILLGTYATLPRNSGMILSKWFKFPKRSFNCVISRLMSWIWRSRWWKEEKYFWRLLPGFQSQLLQLKSDNCQLYLDVCTYFNYAIQWQNSRPYLQNLIVLFKLLGNLEQFWQIKWTLCPGKNIKKRVRNN